jgi:hypothetical protein
MLSTHAMCKEKLGHDFNPIQSCHRTPNVNVLTMNNEYIIESPYENVVPKHKTMQQNNKNQCTTYRNVWIPMGHHPQ